jgi:hypothetical protein
MVRNERIILRHGSVAGRSFTAFNLVKLKDAADAPWYDKLNSYT